ncbi:lipase secretion chaperone [Zooshikella sp. RANM57]|uniref:lipase secretion chaperone n=1 Tax=Zooshikella sp. RANM57 TaxID=3425863 RepID=UPI003D6E6170
MAVNRQRSFLLSALVSLTIVIIAYVVVMYFPVTAEIRNQPLDVIKEDSHQAKSLVLNDRFELDQQAYTTQQAKINLPEYLQDTLVDGSLTVDSLGQLVIHRELRDLFDYFLSVQGLESLEQSVNRLQQYIRLHLRPPAEGQALALLERYLAYKKALVTLENTVIDSGDYLGIKAQSTYDISVLNNRLMVLNQLRQQYFSASTAEAFFGRDNRYDQYMLERITILQNEMFSAEQQMAAISALNASLSDNDKKLFLIADPVSQKKAINVLAGSDDSAKQALITEFGSAAVERLTQLEQMRNQWQQRLANYKQSLHHIVESTMAVEDKTQSIELLLKQSFSTNEQVRVKALVKHP